MSKTFNRFTKTKKKRTQKRNSSNHKRKNNFFFLKSNKEEIKNYLENRLAKAINTHLSVITLNVNGLNVPIARCRVVDRVRKQEPTICCL